MFQSVYHIGRFMTKFLAPIYALLQTVSASSSDLSGVYVWGSAASSIAAETVRGLSLEGTEPRLSFIELFCTSKGTLYINLVRRGSEWPADESFCSLLLPAAIRDFFKRRGLSVLTDLKRIWVMNVSQPLRAGCRCYTKTMVEFGFDLINGEFRSDNFCDGPLEAGTLLKAEPSGTIMVGVSSPKQISYLETAIFRPL